MTTVLVARLDSDGDVLLSGPALRAVRAGCDRLLLLCSPRGAAAAHLLPLVDDVLVWTCPWIEPEPAPVDPAGVLLLAQLLASQQIDRAIVLSSYHQSPLPTALVLRLAGVPWVAATSTDYPGSLLDLRHQLPDTGLHEVERMLSLVEAAGYPARDQHLALRRPLPSTERLTPPGSYLVVHPGASVPSRAPNAAWSRQLVRHLTRAGHQVVVTGTSAETGLTAAVSDGLGVDLGGRTDLAELADVLDRAAAAVVGNTGPAHLAAAVQTPVISLFAPVVPAERWAPWGTRSVVLGDQAAGCRASRARTCPVPGHPCLDGIRHEEVLAALSRVVPGRAA